MKGPHWIKQWINELALLNEQFRDENGTVDFEALGRDEFKFRMALITGRLEKSERAKIAYEQAKAAYEASVENGKKGGRPRKTNGDAPHSDAGDVSTTVSDSMGRVAQNGTHPRIQGGDRGAQAAMSPSPSGAAQDGKFRGSAKTKGESNTGSTVPAVRPESGNNFDAALDKLTRTAGDSTREVSAQKAAPGHKAAAPAVRLPIPSKDEFYDWVNSNRIDEGYARQCFDMEEERGWVDQNGEPVTNWKAFIAGFVKEKLNKRKSA